MKFSAPNKVSLYLFGNDCFIIENFNDTPVDAVLGLPSVTDFKKVLSLPENGNAAMTSNNNSITFKDLSPRTLLVIKYK